MYLQHRAPYQERFRDSLLAFWKRAVPFMLRPYFKLERLAYLPAFRNRPGLLRTQKYIHKIGKMRKIYERNYI